LLSLRRFERDYPGETFALAVSGGADSMALLYWMCEAGVKIAALTVDHGLRSESAAEAEMVRDACKGLGVKHYTLVWEGDKPKSGVEEQARRARYSLMLDWCRANNVGVLATAHQADDQIETFLMNLARGSGVYGLAGIRERREADGIIIYRPLLGVPRAALAEYCDRNKIPYAKDPMNEDEKFLRVRIRKNRAALAALGISDERMGLAIENLARARDYMEAAAREIVRSLNPVEFDAAKLLYLPDEIRFRALSMILADDHPPRLDDIKGAFAKLDGGPAKFTLAGKLISISKGRIRIRDERTEGEKNGKNRKGGS